MDQVKLTGAVDLLGRLLLAALFLYDGWIVINNYGATADYLAQFGMPPLMLVPALILQVAGGLLIAVGWNTRLAALALSFFCISTAVIFHNQFGDRRLAHPRRPWRRDFFSRFPSRKSNGSRLVKATG